MSMQNRDLNTRHLYRFSRRGISLHEVLIAAGVLGILLSLLLPQIERWRERSRATQCTQNLRQLAHALQSYEEVNGTLPPAAVWKPPGEHLGPLHMAKRVDLISHENWLLLLLPHLDRANVSAQWHSGLPIGAEEHEKLRMTSLPELTCPADLWAHAGQYHEFTAGAGAAPLKFARGNYAINGGTHNHQLEPPSTMSPRGDVGTVLIDYQTGTYSQWGNGIAGINRSFSSREMTNGTSTLIALEELRAGGHPLDPRGTWSLGQIGASITWGHGVNGDDYSPNHNWPRADDIQGCDALTEAVGVNQLQEWGMPCVDYIHFNRQATSRSQHPGGVHVAFLDGHVRFISNEIDPGLWHVLHSRETPPGVLSGPLETRLNSTGPVGVHSPTKASRPTAPLVNSIGMAFAVVPEGEFTRDLPDYGGSAPVDRPPRRCQLSNPYLLQTCEISLQQYLDVVGSPPAAWPSAESSAFTSGDLQGPCVNVTWHEANEFCRLLSELESNLGHTYRLPTEAEWEYACRAGNSGPFHFRAQRPLGDESGIAAGVEPPLPLQPCGEYPPNEFGLHDMRGNAWEWCQDWFSRSDTGSSENPQGPASGYLKVVRGSDWRYVGEPCLIDYAMMPPFKANPFVGFRVVCELHQRP